MITANGTVSRIEPDCLWVDVVQQSACGSCAARAGCGQGLLAKWGIGQQRIQVALRGRSTKEFAKGMTVAFGIDERALVSGALLVYLLPLVGLVLGAITGQLLGTDEGWATITGGLGFLMGGAGVYAHACRHRNNSRWQPVLMEKPGQQPLVFKP